jgi:hypothetical protein
MKKYITPQNIIRISTVAMLVWYMNCDDFKHLKQVVDGVKSLFQ